MKRPRGGKAASTRRAVTAVKITSPPKLTAISAITARSSAVIAAASAAWQSPCSRPRASLRAPLLFRARELHRAIVHAGEPELQQIQSIILVQLPRPLRPLLRKHVLRSLDVARAEINRRLFRNRFIPLAWSAPSIPARGHMLQQPAHVLRRQIRLQRPRSVRVTKRRRQIRHIAV